MNKEFKRNVGKNVDKDVEEWAAAWDLCGRRIYLKRTEIEKTE